MNLQRYLIIKKGYPQKICLFTTAQMRWVKIDWDLLFRKESKSLPLEEII